MKSRLNVFLENNPKEYSNLYDTIIAKYYNMNNGHGEQHIVEVIDGSLELNELLREEERVDERLIFVAALYHDVGNKYNRKFHAEIAEEIVRREEILKGMFSNEEINLIALACAEHRSSYKGEMSSMLSKIVNDGDSLSSLDIEPMMKRSINYNILHEVCTMEDLKECVHHHLHIKFGIGGYLDIKLDVARNIANNKDYHNYINDREKFDKKYDEVFGAMNI